MDMTEIPRAEAGDEPRMRADARRSRAKLLEAATAAFAEHGADAPLEDIARRAGVGIGTLYRHFPTRTDLQAGVFRSQVDAVCTTADQLSDTVDRLLSYAQGSGVLRPDISAKDVLRLVHGIVMACEQSPQDTDRLLD